jgi:hypothetical protein
MTTIGLLLSATAVVIAVTFRATGPPPPSLQQQCPTWGPNGSPSAIRVPDGSHTALFETTRGRRVPSVAQATQLLKLVVRQQQVSPKSCARLPQRRFDPAYEFDAIRWGLGFLAETSSSASKVFLVDIRVSIPEVSIAYT